MAASKKSVSKASAQAALVDDARAGALNDFMKTMSKEKPGAVRRLSDGGLKIPVVTTGAISLDWAIGAGGFPRGRIIELFGGEGGGKTTLALTVAANVQREGGNVALVDSENGFNPDLARALGIDEDRFVVFQPNNGEEAIAMVDKMIQSKAFDMVIVDSVAAMTPKAEIDGEMEQQFMGLHARLMSRFMRRVAGIANENNVMLVLINQLRKNIGGYIAFDETPGGRAIKFYSSLRVEVKSNSGDKLIRNKVQYGHTITATVKKNRFAAPFRQATFDLIYGEGIDGAGSLLEVAVNMGIVAQSGAYYTEVATGERFSELDEETGKLKVAVGKDNVKALLRNNKEVYERILAAVRAAMEDDLEEVDFTETADPDLDVGDDL